MWYKTAKQGSLWTIVSPTFEQDIDKALNDSIVSDTNGKYKLDIDLFQEIFINIPDNKLKDLKFSYAEGSTDTNGGYYNSETHEVVMNIYYYKNINLNYLKTALKHEITHAIEYLLPFRNKEIYLGPGKLHPVDNFGTYKSLPNQKPLSNSREDARYDLARDLTVDWSDIASYEKPVDEETLKKRKKILKELDRRKDSIFGLTEFYYANPSELRAVRSEFDTFFNYDHLIQTFHTHYENRENGKEIFLEQFKDLIQTIVSIKDVSSSYKTSELYNNIQETTQYSIDSLLFSQIIRNLDPQYIRQIAKYLTNLYLSVKDYINSYVPDTSETEIL